MWSQKIGGVRVGPIQFMILLQLKREPMYGYEIVKTLRNQFDGVWEPKTGTVYPALRTLEHRGLVKTELRDDREYYSLTEEGEEILKNLDEILGAGIERTGRYYSMWDSFPEFKRFWNKYAYEPSKVWIPRFRGYERDLELKSLKAIRDTMSQRLKGIEKRIEYLQGMVASVRAK
ncbi:MAG: PadR family transcriptional regulator [Thaumarchaeota archaeon]|nr:PadR family transcriptional regulator [Nitrososphaerota archaeon]